MDFATENNFQNCEKKRYHSLFLVYIMHFWENKSESQDVNAQLKEKSQYCEFLSHNSDLMAWFHRQSLD